MMQEILKEDEQTKMVKEKAGEEVSVKVEIPPVITKEKQERPGTESKQEQQLKRKVAQYYGLEEACIEIWWEDDQGEMAVSASVRSDPFLEQIRKMTLNGTWQERTELKSIIWNVRSALCPIRQREKAILWQCSAAKKTVWAFQEKEACLLIWI